MARLTASEIQGMKARGERPVMSIVYDYTTSRIVDKAGTDIILVGDSASRHVLGYNENAAITMEEMILLGRAAVRGSERALVLVDMPFMSYQVSVEDGVRNAGRFVREAGVQAVKLEGNEEIAEVAAAIVRAGIPVQGHMGFTPMTTIALGGFHSDEAKATEEQFRNAAFALQDAGCFSLLFTMVPPDVSGRLTKELRIPTFAGGGSGQTDGYLAPVGLNLGSLDRGEDQYGVTPARMVHDRVQKFIEDVRNGKVPR